MKDLLKDNTGDVMIANNDLVMGVSDNQHREDLLLDEKGSIKQFPDTGVGAQTFLESEDDGGLLREIALQFTADGMEVKKLSVVNNKVVFEAPYK